MMSAVEHFAPSDFEPAVVERQVHAISRPSLSYWQDAARRLRNNWRASASLATVIGLGRLRDGGTVGVACGPGCTGC